VDRPRALDHVTVVVDEDEVADPHQAEVQAERVDPEVIEPFGIPDRDVPRRALVVAEPGPDAERRGQLLLAGGTLLLGRGERRELDGGGVRHGAESTSGSVDGPVGPAVTAGTAGEDLVERAPQVLEQLGDVVLVDRVDGAVQRRGRALSVEVPTATPER